MRLSTTAALVACAIVAGCGKNESQAPMAPTTCAYSASMSSQSPGAQGGSFDLGVTKTGGTCSWFASTDANWITFSSAAAGTDTGIVKVNVAANGSTSSRVGSVRVSWTGGMAQIAVNQKGLTTGECNYSFAPSIMTMRPEGGFGSVPLTVTGFGCRYDLVSDASWLILTAAPSGTTSSPIGFDALPNNDASERTAMITASFDGGDTRVAIKQMPRTDCRYTFSPSSQDAPAAGGSFSFVANRNTPNGCSWAASATVPWIRLTGPASGLSGATVSYAVEPNTSGAPRKGAINITWSGGTADFVITQTP